MSTSEHMRKEGKYPNKDYHDKFLEIYIKNFILRISEIIALKDYKNVDIDKESFDETFPILQRMFEKEKKYQVLKRINSHYFMLLFHYM